MKLYLRTFGCRANQYDSEAMRAMAEAAGVEMVDAPDDADAAVFNSCGVTADAVADLRQQVRRASRANPALRTVVTGCASALAGERESLRALPTVHELVAGADLPAVAAALGLPARAMPPARQTGARALLRIQDGCDEHCTFCATTLARGLHRSRPARELVAEALALSEHHAEIVLTGVHIGGWGREWDLGLGELVERLVDEVPDVRFRLTSIEATEVDERLAELLVAMPRRVAPHLHAPLQSGSDRMLRRMGRHWYTAARYATAVERLAARAHPFALSGDVITGFPGETAEDHAATLALVRTLPFTSLHVFPYSPRAGTPALRLPDPVPERVARERAAELREVAAERSAAYRASRAGGAADVVVIGRGARPHGLTEDYLEVSLDAPAGRRPDRFDAVLDATATGLSARAFDTVSG